jgi:lysozyme
MKLSSSPLAAILAIAVAATVSVGLSPASGSGYALSIAIRQTPSIAEPIVTLYGELKPARKNQKVTIQVELESKWRATALSTQTTSNGTWRIEAVATALRARVKYRALTAIGSKSIYSVARTIKIQQIPEIGNVDPTTLIDEAGPGGRIHGMDISRWQHPNSATIDFTKMYAAGVRFIMIKASDTHDLADAEALKYLVMDQNAAQAAGIYTGFYYYSTLPDSTDSAVIIADAQAQAQKAIWRLASLGGYTNRDLPYALDLENNCIRVGSNGACTSYASRTNVTLWATTWLAAVASKTGRLPILYSYPQFLENGMVRSAVLVKYPLWIAHYGIDPGDPLAQPGQKTAGCFVHSWTTANCSSLWMIWQYTSCGIAKKYGVPGSRVDLDVFRGTPRSFLDLVKGIWTPEISDLMPVNEPSQMNIGVIGSTTANKPVTFAVNVTRPSGTPVVTGTVKFIADISTPLPASLKQTVVRFSSGSWLLTIKPIPAGTWTGAIVYTDISGTHATSSAPVSFNVLPGPTPSPTPSPTTTTSPTPSPTATASPKPTADPCQYQIKN